MWLDVLFVVMIAMLVIGVGVAVWSVWDARRK